MNKQYCSAVIVAMLVSGCSAKYMDPTATSNENKTAVFYSRLVNSVPTNGAQLNLFVNRMPKGGDLHHHFTGSIYAETYLDWVAKAGYWINRRTLRIDTSKTKRSITVSQLRKNTTLYRKLLSKWSDLDYHSHYHQQPPPDLNFFDTFGYFDPISNTYLAEGLNILKQRALKENVIYIETMFTSVPYKKPNPDIDEQLRIANKKRDAESIQKILADFAASIRKDKRFGSNVARFVSTVEKAHEGIDESEFMMRYQSYATRNSAPSVVFSKLYAAFAAAKSSELVVGVNIVGPENGIVAIQDYFLHMQMFRFCHAQFPTVNRALHAGELTLGMVRPKNLKFHIRSALEIAKAQRIGHAVDLPYEENSVGLLEEIRKNAAVEINLTSNEFILGVKGNNHPYLVYSAYHVPLIISTDDSGVSRNNLSQEYFLLSSRYKPDYKTLKAYAYNSIKYAFLPKEAKASLVKLLNARFTEFESEMADYSHKLRHNTK